MSKKKRKKGSAAPKHSDSGLAHVDIVPAEEFTRVEPYGEYPEWRPGDVRSVKVGASGDSGKK